MINHIMYFGLNPYQEEFDFSFKTLLMKVLRKLNIPEHSL